MSSTAPLRIVFLGSDSIALPLLDWFESAAGRSFAEVVAVFTQPDRPVGRGQKVTANSIKTWALGRALPVFQPLLRLSRRKYWIAGVDAPSNDPSAMDVAAASLAASRQAVAAVLATL